MAKSSPSRIAFVSPSAASRVNALAEELRKRAAADPLLVLGRTRSAADEVVRGTHSAATFGWQRTTLDRYAERCAVANLAARTWVSASRAVQFAVVVRVAHEALRTKKLGRFMPIADKPGFARALASTLEELRLGGKSPEDLADVEPELSYLLRSYTEELERDGLADRTVLLRSAAVHAPFPGDVFLCDVPLSFAAEAAFLGQVLSHAKAAFATVPRGDVTTQQRLSDLGFELRVLAPADSPLGALQQRLFASEQESAKTKAASSEALSVVSAPGESREAVEIARKIQRLARGGARFDKIAVLLRNPELYRESLEEAFRRAAIPVYFARGARKPHTAGRALLALLHCAREGLSAARFSEYLSLGQVPELTPGSTLPAPLGRFVPPEESIADGIDDAAAEAQPPPEDSPLGARDPEERPVVEGTLRAPRLWERMLVEGLVIGGLERWKRRLAELESRQAYARSVASADDGEHWAREEAALASLRTFALPVLTLLSELPARATWGEWMKTLSALTEQAIRHVEPVLAAIAEFAPMASVGPVSIDEVISVLTPRLESTFAPTVGGRHGKVYVAHIDESRGLVFDVVFVPGCVEKQFPALAAEDPLLLDDVRARLPGLTLQDDRVRAERLRLELAVGAAEKELVVSYARLDLESGRPRTPSFYALELVRANEGILHGFDALAERASAHAQARLGWPAPKDPAEAIDEVEHDLSMLERLLYADESEFVGVARYLLSVNAHLARALRVRALRWNQRKWSQADGFVEPGDLGKAALQPHMLSQRSFSPTALQHFAACPYRFFLQAIWRLAPKETPEAIEDLDALQRGSLVHEAQFRLLLRLRERGLLPFTPGTEAAVSQELDSVITEVAARFKEELAPAIERVWIDGIAGIRADLAEWLRRLRADSRYEPAFFELSFGLTGRDDRDPRSQDDAVELPNGLKLRGSIDLVERRTDGVLRATDHKTGRVRAEKGSIVSGGEILQPVLYALVLENMIKGAKVEGGRLSYCTQAGAYEMRDIPLDATARASADMVVATIGQALERGFFPAAPAEDACKYCDYARVCGPYEELRVKKKLPGPLSQLVKLRGLS
ncbi:MAG: PD-(D/E)XK nuclease family protein [Polyangiaceae bacterium]